jgi:hypothetical protein
VIDARFRQLPPKPGGPREQRQPVYVRLNPELDALVTAWARRTGQSRPDVLRQSTATVLTGYPTFPPDVAAWLLALGTANGCGLDPQAALVLLVRHLAVLHPTPGRLAQ